MYRGLDSPGLKGFLEDYTCAGIRIKHVYVYMYGYVCIYIYINISLSLCCLDLLGAVSYVCVCIYICIKDYVCIYVYVSGPGFAGAVPSDTPRDSLRITYIQI